MRTSNSLRSLCLTLPLLGACAADPPADPIAAATAEPNAAAAAEPTVEPTAEPGAAASLQPVLRPETPRAEALRAAAERLERVELGSMALLHRVDDLWLGSQPDPDDLALLVEGGLRTVVSLRDGDEPVGFNEERLVEQLRLRFASVAFDELHNLDDSVFRRVRALLNDPTARPLLLHCGTGNRVGPVWIAWRVLDQGASWDAAFAEARLIGLRFLPYADKARAYIEREQAG